MTGWDDLSPEEQDDAADAYLVAEKEQGPEPTEPPDLENYRPWPVYSTGEQVPAGTRVMWAHGRGIGGAIIPRAELSELFSLDETTPATYLAVLWDDGTEMVMDASSLAPMTEDGPEPYPEPDVTVPAWPDGEAPF